MRKKAAICVMLFLFSMMVQGQFLRFHGARSMALGFGARAWAFDFNSVYLNPALLYSVSRAISGYQYQTGNLHYGAFLDHFNDIGTYQLRDYASFSLERKEDISAHLRTLFSGKRGIMGFRDRGPGLAFRNYGFSVATVRSTFVLPGSKGIDLSTSGAMSDEVIASLNMRFLTFKYNQYSVAYGVNLTRGISMGVNLHYMSGKASDFSISLADDLFLVERDTDYLLQYGWDRAETKISRFNTDLAFNLEVAANFSAALIAKNLSQPKFLISGTEIQLPRRYIAALGFRPDPGFGLYLDADIIKFELYDERMVFQPFSLGIEKGLFKNNMVIRAGLFHDLTEKDFFGKDSPIQYSLGLGFNMGHIVCDVALGLDRDGMVRSLAISGYYLIR